MKPGTDLFHELELAQAECARLREENTRLKKQLLNQEQMNAAIDAHEESLEVGTPTRNPFRFIQNESVTLAKPAVTNASDPSAKIDLFRALFRGREDIYAIRWVGRNGKSGYSPAAPRSEGTSLIEDRRFIEVKGRAYRGPISLSANEYSAAKRLGRTYWLYVVFNCASAPEVLVIKDPARLNWKPLSKIEQYQVAASDIVEAKP